MSLPAPLPAPDRNLVPPQVGKPAGALVELDASTVVAERRSSIAFHVSVLLVATRHQLAQEVVRADVAEAESALLRLRLHELESWVEHSAHFEEVEHLQLGRLLARSEEEREAQRLRLFVSLPAFLVAAYAVALGVLAWLLLTGRL